MFKANTGYSTGASAFDAGKEAAAQAVEGLDAPKVAFVYCSCDYNVTAVVDGVKEAIPGVPVLGNTSFTGVIVSDGGYVGGDEPFVGVMVLSSPEMAVGIAAADRAQNDDPFEAGLIMAEAALDAAGKDVAPDFFYMAASPAEEELYLKGISSVIGRVPFFGGSAGRQLHCRRVEALRHRRELWRRLRHRALLGRPGYDQHVHRRLSRNG